MKDKASAPKSKPRAAAGPRRSRRLNSRQPRKVKKPRFQGRRKGKRPEDGAPISRTSSLLDYPRLHFAKRLKQLRNTRGWSLDALAKASGVSRSMLSQIERNQANPTLVVAFRIARAFGMSLGELAEVGRAASSTMVIRAGDRAYQYRSDRHVKIRTLSPLHLEKDVEFYEVQLKQRGALRSPAHFDGTREFLTVQKGRVRIESGNEAEELEQGDSANYRADVAHAIVNIGRGDAVVFLVDIYR